MTEPSAPTRSPTPLVPLGELVAAAAIRHLRVRGLRGLVPADVAAALRRRGWMS